MATPRSRSKTNGAFGKTKKRPTASVFSNVPAGMPVRQTPAGEFNISDALIQFAKPVTEQAGNNHTAIRGAMNVAVLLWNSLVEGEKAVAAAKEKLLGLPGAEPEQVDELIATMTARKQELYPDAKQLVCDFTLDFSKKGINIRVASMNTAPAGVEKTVAAEVLGTGK